ncbi:MAG: hypothetical protein ABSB42_04480 [Tepidisphaeraceae bacterium]|jgi:hypothetical protein
MAGSQNPTLNSITLGGKTVYDPPPGGRPTNVMTMYTGGSRYGIGRFLMLVDDFNALMEDTPAGMVTLEMKGAPGPGISFSVCLAAAIPYVTGPTASDGNTASTQSFANMVEAIVFDNRWQLTDPITCALNVHQQGFPYSGTGSSATPIYYPKTTNNGTAWNWSDVCTQLNVDPDIPDPVPSSWKPRNMIFDNVAEGKVLDDVAGQLFLVVGFSDNSYTTTDFYNPGQSTGGSSQSDSGNTQTLQDASNYIIQGQDWIRNDSRFPSKVGVTFKVNNQDNPFDPYSDISDDPTSGNNTRCYEVDVSQPGEGGSQNFTLPMMYGNFVAIRSGGSVTNTSELSTVANDVGGRYYTMTQLKMSEKKYAGIWPFVPDGLVRGVQWVSDAKGAVTTVRFNDQRDFCPAMEPMRAVESISNQLVIGMGTTNTASTPQGSRLLFGTGELVLVAIIGAESGGGYYKGSILYGVSNGGNGGSNGNPPGFDTFQLQSQVNQSACDGPAPLTNTNQTLKNNALVVNLAEPYVGWTAGSGQGTPGSHVLWGNVAEVFYVIGRVMGTTQESTPRTIVYVDNWPVRPCIAKITGVYQGTYGGVYYGRIAQGQFASSGNFGFNNLLSSLSSAFFPSGDNCWITNNWEQTYSFQARNGLAVGTMVWGIVAGFPQYSTITSGNSNSNNIWYQVYTWFPPQSAALTHAIQNLVTDQTAGSTYGINEQTMMNNLKTDVTNLQAALSNLYANLKTAGYSL